MDLPLRERVVAPTVIPMPSNSGIVWRAAVPDDISTIHACAREMDPVDHPHWTTTVDDIAEEFDHSYTDMTRDSLVAVDGNGEIEAFGFVTLSPGRETLVRSILAGGVRPRSRGLGMGRQLLDWQVARGMQQLASSDSTLPGWLLVHAEEVAVEAARLYTRAGFSVSRYYLELTRDLADAIPLPELDEGLRIVQFTPERDSATLAARNDAFRDHWGSQPQTPEQWTGFTANPVFRHDLSWLAISGDGDVAGFLLASVNQDDWEPQGFSSAYFDLVGTPRAHRGRGVASALLAKALAACEAAGLERAVLDVDSENPTGALGIYTRLGFTESSRSMSFTRVH